MKRKKIKLKWKNIIILAFILICLFFLIISVKDVVKWNLDSNKIDEQVQEIQDIVIIKEVIESDEIEIIE